ncbi:MAG: DUF3488 domain-containing protein [Oscillatoriales cyanobacterium]|nr:MAG: DUF3488 domain-containing protein [Oscillatoriales cyanobacterium]
MQQGSDRHSRRGIQGWIGQVRAAIAALPKIQPEESIGLRVAVQAMVTIGIIATDVAAETTMSFWAVPLSLFGAWWSWGQRSKRNMPVKFLLALGMIGALGLFFNNLMTSLNDTRLTLAELLIQVQVLHSFDLPRRKDLGYSMTIGLILMGVAATLSQTMAFAPLLLLFLVFTLPSLLYDYRSRLGLPAERILDQPSRTGHPRPASLPWRTLAGLLAATLAIGMIIFILMPRLPGYQIRSFPVSADIPFQGEFDGRNLVSPGITREDGTDPTGSGGMPTEGPGQVDEENYYGFSDRINQNLRGTMQPQVVMRVRSQAPGFWRVMAFDHYTGQGWEVSDRDETQKYERSNWSYRFSLPPVYSESGQKEIIQTYTLVKDLPGIIPTLDRAAYLYFPTQEVALDREDAIRSPVILAEGLTYSVISFARYRDRTLLGQAGTEYKDRIRDRYLDIPDTLRDRLRQYTEAVLAKSAKPITSPYEQALYLAQHLKQTFVIPENPLDLPFLAEGDDLVEQFLFLCENSPNPRCQSGGYPDHFSTVLTMMLRSIGIPSRLVVGFGAGEFNPFTGLYEVKNTDAYAMTEVYFPKHGWFAFDPIPGHEIIPPSPVDYEAFGVVRKLWSWVAGWLPSPLTGVLQGVFNGIGRLLGWVLQQFGQGWGGLLIGLAALTGGGFLGWLGWYGAMRWRYQRRLAGLSDAERLYQQILDWSADQGLPKRAAQTPLEYLDVVRERYPAEVATAIEQAIGLYLRWHYGGERVSVTAAAAEFAQAKQTWRKQQRRHMRQR